MLERLDAVVGALRAAAERSRPGRAVVAIVSDHGFARTDAQLNLFAGFRDAGLITIDGKGRITDWKAMPWTAGGSVGGRPQGSGRRGDAGEVRALLDRLAADPAHGIDRVLDAPRARTARRLSHRVVPRRAQAGTGRRARA